jgi:hypothetical protein
MLIFSPIFTKILFVLCSFLLIYLYLHTYLLVGPYILLLFDYLVSYLNGTLYIDLLNQWPAHSVPLMQPFLNWKRR